MIKVCFICHGSTAGSRELAAFVGQNGANRGSWESGLLRFYYEWGNEKRAVISRPFSWLCTWFYFLRMSAAVLQKGIFPKASLCSQNSRVSRRASQNGVNSTMCYAHSARWCSCRLTVEYPPAALFFQVCRNTRSTFGESPDIHRPRLWCRSWYCLCVWP